MIFEAFCFGKISSYDERKLPKQNSFKSKVKSISIMVRFDNSILKINMRLQTKTITLANAQELTKKV